MLSIAEKRELYMKAYNENKEVIDKRIADGIEKNRKGNCCLKLTDKAGKPLANTSVKVVQKNHEFNFGANIFMLDEFENEDDNKEYRRFFKEYFNAATVPFYWDALEPVEGKPRYAKGSEKIYRRPTPDLCVEYCEQNGIRPKLHCLVYEHFVPEWLKKLNLEEVKKAYEKRFAEISKRYCGKMFEFEVVNEILIEWTDGTELAHQKDIIEWAFSLAHKYFQNETLVLNEGLNRLEQIGGQGYRSPYYMLLENAILKGVDFDKIGIQNHLFTGTTAHTEEEYEESIRHGVPMSDPVAIFKGLDILSKLGKPIEITEVTVPTLGDSVEDEDLQADLLKLWFSIWFSHPAVDGVIYWNTVDGYAHTSNPDWVENNCRGGLFHNDLTPKKSAVMLKKLTDEIWHTEFDAATDNEGNIKFNGFYGDYILKTGDLETMFAIKKDNENNYIISI